MEAIVLQIAWWSRKKTYPAIYVPGIWNLDQWEISVQNITWLKCILWILPSLWQTAL
jgi:hypothetical protein